MDNKAKQQFSFKKYAWNQFKKNKPAKYSLYLLILIILIAIFAPFIANERPLYANYKGNIIYPAFTEETKQDSIFNTDGNFERILSYNPKKLDWRTLDYEKVIWAPIVYGNQTMDKYNRNFVSPNGKQRYKNSDGKIVEIPRKFRHYLGTDNLGRDLAAGLIHGTRIALLVGRIAIRRDAQLVGPSDSSFERHVVGCSKYGVSGRGVCG